MSKTETFIPGMYEPFQHHLTGCPAAYPWDDDCIHYSGPGSLERLAEIAKSIVLKVDAPHIKNVLNSTAQLKKDKVVGTPDFERNRLVQLLDGDNQQEQTFQISYESYLKHYEEEKARDMVAEQRLTHLSTIAACFLEAYNYDIETLLTTGKLVKAYQPVKTATLEQVKEVILSSLDLWTSDADSEYSKEPWYNAGSNDVVSLLLNKYFGGEIIVQEYSEDASGWDIPEDEDEEEYDDVGRDYYYILRLEGEDVDLFSQTDQESLRLYGAGGTELLGEKPADVAELEGDAWRMSRFSILERRVHNLLTTGKVVPLLHTSKW